MKLDEILQLFEIELVECYAEISSIVINSKQAKKNTMFVAMRGYQGNGADYINEAIANGALAILQPGSSNRCKVIDGIYYIYLNNFQNNFGRLISAFYGDPSKSLKVIGVTGTNGKTTITQLIAQLIDGLGGSCGLIGTLGIGFYNNLTKSNLTTPDIIQLQASLQSLYSNKATHVAIEVSSHAISQSRISGTDFELTVFSNISHEHLDYHQTFNDYMETKFRLFTEHSPNKVVINFDDPSGKKLAKRLHNVDVAGYSLEPDMAKESQHKLIYASDCNLTMNGMQAKVNSPWGTGEISCGLIGKFNLSNLLAAIASCCQLGFDFKQILQSVSNISSIPGRMEIINNAQNRPQVVVDYAHTPDALQLVLQALTNHDGKLWCVFGCGGSRDPSKRNLMYKVVQKYANYIVVTQDNPRDEDPNEIIRDILADSKDENTIVELDRSKAIQYALENSSSKDTILIAGKGHEDYQLVGNQRLKFSDQQCVKQFFEESSSNE